MSHSLITRTAPAGSFQGVHETGINKFLGIRYAQAPLGDARFQPPKPVPPNTELVDATQYGDRNFQFGWPEEVLKDLELQGEESEDCLFLNIFAPENSSQPKPVLVWIHGGAFMCGSGNDYDPSNIVADNEVVVVSINYRLGIFGFLNLENLGPGHEGSANLGIQDQIAALRWVNENITAFGGDASNITIWGESAGAASVLALLGAPAAEGLFHKGIVFSGAETLTPPTDQLSLIKACLDVESDQDCLQRLQTLPAHELHLLQQQSQIYVGPSVDGVVITRPACEAIKDGGAAGIPIIAGATTDEGTLLAPAFAPTDEMGAAMIMGLACSIGRDDGASYLQFLAGEVNDVSVVQRMSRAWFDTFRASALRVACTAAQYGAGGWVYNFDVETDHPLGVAHFADVPFTFNWIEEGNPGLFVHPPTPINQQLAQQWSRTIMAFAKTGSPNGHGLPEWPQYQPDAYQCLRLSQQPEIVANPDGDLLTIYRVE